MINTILKVLLIFYLFLQKETLNKENLLGLARTLFSTFGTREDLAALVIEEEGGGDQVLLSKRQRFREFTISRHLRDNILYQDKITKNSNCLYKLLVRNIISDQYIWANSNAKLMLNRYGILAAAAG